MQDILYLFVLAGTIALIARWRWKGILISIFLGWGIVHIINVSYPSTKWERMKFAEDWPLAGWFLMLLWSVLALGAITIVRQIRLWFSGNDA